MIEGLINTLNLLFEKNPKLIFYHCYIERSLELHYNLLIAYRDNGFIVEYVGKEVTDRFKEKTYQYPHLHRIMKKPQLIANDEATLQNEKISDGLRKFI